MLNNKPNKDQLSNHSREELLLMIDQQKKERDALFEDFMKAHQKSVLYWVMQDLFALRAITDPIHYLDQVQALSRRYAAWGMEANVTPF